MGGREDSGGVPMKMVVLEACMQRELVTDTGHAECYLQALTPDGLVIHEALCP